MRSHVALPHLVMCALASALAFGCSHEQAASYLTTPSGGSSYATGSYDMNHARLKPELCRDVPENKPDEGMLDEGALVAFLQRMGYHTTTQRARADLTYVDVTDAGGDQPVRFRVAILPTRHAAGNDLHNALLAHGPGSWGVHRANLAVLAPIGNMGQILELAGKTKLACWGVLTVAARDDDFVVPGGYFEF